MILKNRTHAALAAACALVLSAFAQTASAASGAYGSSAVAPTIYSKNLWYNVPFSVVGSPTPASTVRAVYYSWSYSTPRPSGFLVYLCNNTGSVCFDVTSAASGSVDFTAYGVPATQNLRLYSRVSGTGTMSPLYGGSSNVTVNWAD